MILICGGAGYIGSHMAKLLRKGRIPHLVLDNFERGHVEAIAGSPYVRADLRDADSLGRVFAEHSVTTVMHFAAYIEVGESVVDPAAFWQNNVAAVLNLLGAMRTAEVANFVFSSTAAVYGEPERTPIAEDHPCRPTSPYGKTKLAVEQVLQDYDHAYGLKSVCLRYFNACGADPEGELGEDHSPESHLIPRVLFAAQGKVDKLTVFGTDYPTVDGTCVRDYVHVEDLATAHLAAVRRLESGGGSLTANLGSGTGFSVKQVIQAAEAVTGRTVPVEYGPRRAGDPAVLVADSTLAQNELGWKPVHTRVETCVQHAWDWFVSHPDGY